MTVFKVRTTSQAFCGLQCVLVRVYRISEPGLTRFSWYGCVGNTGFSFKGYNPEDSVPSFTIRGYG